MYKIYFLDKVLQLGAEKEEAPSIAISEIADKKALKSFLRGWLENEERQDVILKGYPAKKMFRHIKESVNYVKAAGGVVRNQKNKFLFIKRWGIWDLPKGKMEKSEKIESCALREVQEETGVEQLKIMGRLPNSYHIYSHKGETVLKKTCWFFMETDFTGALRPQQEEDISQALWLDATACAGAFGESYRSLRESLENAVCELL